MAKSFAKPFYNSMQWKQCRESYIRKMPAEKRGLCEECYKQGKHVLGEELHHKVWLTPRNIHDPNVTLNHDNLILLCYDCHKKIHGMRNENCYSFDSEGNMIPVQKHTAPI